MLLRFSLTALFALLIATSAHGAPGLNLRWNVCYGDGGASSRSFACDRNSGFQSLVGSFELGSEMSQVSGIEITIDVYVQNMNLPEWWLFSAPLGGQVGCRGTALSINPIIPSGATGCVDWAPVQAAGGLASYKLGFYDSSSARILAAIAIPGPFADLRAAVEYFVFTVRILNTKTVGTGACGGCMSPVNLVLTELNIVPGIQLGTILTGPTNGYDSNMAYWAPQVTPVRGTTWAAVKSLYR